MKKRSLVKYPDGGKKKPASQSKEVIIKKLPNTGIQTTPSDNSINYNNDYTPTIQKIKPFDQKSFNESIYKKRLETANENEFLPDGTPNPKAGGLKDANWDVVQTLAGASALTKAGKIGYDAYRFAKPGVINLSKTYYPNYKQALLQGAKGLLPFANGGMVQYQKGGKVKPNVSPDMIRTDGTLKGKGFLGNMPNAEKGKISSELSIGIELDGKETLIPTMVPTLNKMELDYLLNNQYNPQARNGVSDIITRKAEAFAKSRRDRGLPYFAKPEEEGTYKVQPLIPRVPNSYWSQYPQQYPNGGTVMKEYKYGGIHIKPENKGKFTATKKATGKSTEELTHSKNPVTRKRAIFAQNAAKWQHAEGGILGETTTAIPSRTLRKFDDGGIMKYPIGGETVPGTVPIVPPVATPTWNPDSQSMPKYIYNTNIGKDGNATYEMADQATQAKYNQGLIKPEWFQMGIGERRAPAPTAAIPQPVPAAPMAYNKSEWGRYNNSSAPGQMTGYSYTHYPTGKVYNEADYNAIRNPVAPIAPAALATRANGGYIPSRSLRKFDDGGTWAGVDEQGNPIQTSFNKSTAGSNVATGAAIAGAVVPMITNMIPDNTIRDSDGNPVGQKVGTGKALANGAASGAAMGANFGGVGALVGAGVGAIYGGISNNMANNKVDAEMKQANSRISNRKLDNRMTTNNNAFATQDYNNNDMVYAAGGMVVDQHMDDPNAELELNETFQEPSGQVGMVDGPSHDNGGVEVNLEEGTRIWSDRLKHNGKTFASLTRPIVNKIEKLEKTSPTDYNSRFKQNSKMLLNKQLDHLFEVQETNKQQDEMKRSLKNNAVVNDRGNYHYAVGGVMGGPRNTLTSAGNFNFTPTNSSYGINAGLNRQFGANRNLNLGLNTNLGLDYTRPMPSQEGSVMVPTVKPNANVSMTGEYNRGNNNFAGNVSYNPYNQGVEGRVAYTRKFSMGGYLPKHWDGSLIGNDPKEQYRLPNGTYNKMQYAADQLNPATFKNPSQTFNRPEPNPGTYSGVTQYGINPAEFQTYMSKNGMLNGTNRTAPTVEGFNAWKNAPPITTDDNNVLGNNYNKQNFDPSYAGNFDRYNPAPPEQPFTIPDKSFFSMYPNSNQQPPMSASNNNQQPPLYTVDQPGTQTNFAEEGMKDKTAPATKKSNWFKDNANTLGQIGSIAGTLGLQNRNLNRLPAPRTIADVNFQNQIANPKYMDLSAERASINRTGMGAMDEAQRQFGSSAAAQAFKNKARLNQLEGTGKSYQTQENANTGIYNEFAGMKGEAGIKQAAMNSEIAKLNAENWYSDKAMRTANKNAALATAGHGVGEIFGNKAKYANELDKAGMLANQFDPSVLSSIANNNPELADKFMKEGRFTAAQWKAATGKDWVEKKAYGGTIKKRSLKK